MFPLVRTLLVALVSAVPAAAQTAATATLSANLGPLAKLSFSSNTITFTDADPDTSPELLAAPIAITAKARATAGSTIALTVLAADDLRSGINTLPADSLTWTASGAGFNPGTVSRTAAQVVASWSGSGVRMGMQIYRFQNRWSHPVGTYTVSLVYTLTSP
jgi:hypothetical protein